MNWSTLLKIATTLRAILEEQTMTIDNIVNTILMYFALSIDFTKDGKQSICHAVIYKIT